MATLHAAFALTKVNRPSVLVGEDLDFNVLGTGQQSLDVHPSVAEGGDRLSTCSGGRLVEFRGVVNGPHAFSAAAAGGFEQKRIAHALGGLAERF